MHRWQFLVLPAAFVCAAAGAQAEEPIDFARDIRPLLSENCFQCHGPDETHREADLRLDLRSQVIADHAADGIVVPGRPDESVLWQRISDTDESVVMPPPDSLKALTSEQRDLIRRWIESGAVWTDHWAFVAPQRPDVPPDNHPIDYFVNRQLHEKGLPAAPPADPITLIRRAHLDLTGLPPTPERVIAFVRDYERDPEQAWQSLIDELLTSPHYGERMALMWLDAARYGDTSVMHADGPRTMWPWRDWVVRSWNRNQPYDQFSIEQIAGDLLPEATTDQKVASGFNRNHATSDEGGAIPEELRVSYVVDRVNTTASVWMGLTLECAQCHDHKYDPISQREYYGMYAWFNNHVDPGMQTREGNQAPVVEVPDPEVDARIAAARQQVETARQAIRDHRESARPAFDEWLSKQPVASAGESIAWNSLVPAHWFPLNNVKGDRLPDYAAAVSATKSRGAAELQMRTENEQALSLNGSTVYSPGDPVVLPHNGPFSFSAWIRIDEPVTGAICSCMDPQHDLQGFDFWVQDGHVGAHLIHRWPANALKVISRTPLASQQWHHVVIAFDGSAKAAGVSLWIDGQLSEIRIENDSLSESIETGMPFLIGARSGGSEFRGALADLRIYRSKIKEEQLPLVQADPVQQILAKDAAQWTEPEQNLLFHYFLATSDATYLTQAGELASAIGRVTQAKSPPTTSMIMADNPPEQRRPTWILNRGSYDQPREDEEILPTVPAVLPPLSPDDPPNRLGLARWLFRDDHPLTARVAVNQIWQVFFGGGIVRTPRDFGAQGRFPTHPALLDWLAVDFRENGWDTKRLIRMILTSETYRRSSAVRPEQRRRDPDNLWLSRATRFRLQGEFIRDTALFTSGLLRTDLIGGPGVKPYQPAGLWAEVGLGGNPRFVQDTGDKLYRRSLYSYWKRSAPPPAMLIFDAPTRETCTMQRARTNTPLQALVLMNDVQFVEASRCLAERMLSEAGGSPDRIAARGFELTTLRTPDPEELKELLSVHAAAVTAWESDPQSVEGFLSVGERRANEETDRVQLAAWTVVAGVLLNLDETLTRE